MTSEHTQLTARGRVQSLIALPSATLANIFSSGLNAAGVLIQRYGLRGVRNPRPVAPPTLNRAIVVSSG